MTMKGISEICLSGKRLQIVDKEARKEIAILKDKIEELWKLYSDIMEK